MPNPAVLLPTLRAWHGNSSMNHSGTVVQCMGQDAFCGGASACVPGIWGRGHWPGRIAASLPPQEGSEFTEKPGEAQIIKPYSRGSERVCVCTKGTSGGAPPGESRVCNARPQRPPRHAVSEPLEPNSGVRDGPESSPQTDPNRLGTPSPTHGRRTGALGRPRENHAGRDPSQPPRSPRSPRGRRCWGLGRPSTTSAANPTRPLMDSHLDLSAQSVGNCPPNRIFFHLKEVRSWRPSAQWERWKFPERTGPMGAASAATIGGPSDQSLSQKTAPPPIVGPIVEKQGKPSRGARPVSRQGRGGIRGSRQLLVGSRRRRVRLGTRSGRSRFNGVPCRAMEQVKGEGRAQARGRGGTGGGQAAAEGRGGAGPASGGAARA
ncbi:hypothetical protein HPG69_013721 [Diceros bicornis minor]|uniref:Uncharacterized protein n=1 Tax=Diceros bicornis minor TaxID=77932 RepID=A0A7J7EJG0_DICBM|nr:hypothetical protein HPG69_013721 [Diceros bicornis minor]